MANIFRTVYYVKTWWPELQPPDNSLRTWTYNFTIAASAPSVITGPQQLRTPLFIKTRWPEYETRLQFQWTWKYPQTLIGKDKMIAGKQVYDLPPVGKYTRQVDLNTWTWKYVLELIGKDRLNPGKQSYDLSPKWLIPAEPATRFWTYNLLLTTLAVPPTPLLPLDWPNPKTPYYDISLRTWVSWYNLNLIGQDFFPPGNTWDRVPPHRDRPQPILQNWTLDLQQSTLQPLPYGDQWTTLSPIGPRPIDQTWIINLLTSTLGQPTPFLQYNYDWPTPKGPYFDISLRSWTWQYNLNLIGQDQLPVGDQSFALTPVGPRPIDQTWVVNLQQTTLVAITTPFAQHDWPVPRGYDYAATLRTWTGFYNLNLVGQDKLPVGEQRTELVPAAFAPTFERRGLAWFYNINLIGQDVLTVGEQVFDRPPLGPIQPVRTWTWSYLLTLVGRDFLSAGKVVTDLVPRPPAEPATRTWTWNYNLNLIGQDQLATGVQIDDLPPIGPPTTAYRSWVAFSPLALNNSLGVTIGKATTDLTPAAAPYAITLRTFLGALPPAVVALPFSETDWPLPQGPLYAITLRTWTWSYLLPLIGQDATLAGKEISERPPLAPLPPENVKSWIQSVNIALITAPQKPGGAQIYDLTPPGPRQAALGQASGFPLELIGQDFITAGKAVTDLARGISATDLRSWIQAAITAISPIGIQISDLPPRAPQQPALGQATAFPLSLIGQDALPVGKQVTDLAPRPAPTTDYRSWIQFTSLALNGSLGIPIGDQLWQLAPTAAQPAQDLRTWLQATKLALLVPFNQTDWPLPGRPQVPQRTYTFNLSDALTQTATPFNQYDWPLPQRYTQLPRTWSASFPEVLVGQDFLPPGRQIYDRSPPGFIYSQDLRSLVNRPQITPTVVVSVGAETLLSMGVG